MLVAHRLTVGEVEGWAVHPGSAGILDVVGAKLRLGADPLAERGNCSFAGALVVLEDVRRHRQLRSGSPVVMLAFGPGLTIRAALLRGA